MPKLAVIFSNLGPYHVARLNSLHTFASSQNWEVIAIELARQEVDYAWEIDINSLAFRVISLTRTKALESSSFVNLLMQMYLKLQAETPDVVAIAGYYRPLMLAALVWCKLQHKPAILFSASNEHDAERTYWKERLKHFLVKYYSTALVGGKSQRRYLEKLGMKSESIFQGYNTVDNQIFHPSTIRTLPKPLKNSYFLAINRFVPKKNLSLLISSYYEYRNTSGIPKWDLVLCGDGELRPQLEQQIDDLKLQSHVHLTGFLQQNELLPYLAHASCFVHVSTEEQWGLVVNEAMASGLPVIISNRCGCFEDLVIEQVTGFGFDPENGQQLTQLLITASSSETNLAEMGKAALAHIQNYSPDHFARNVLRAVEYSLSHSN